MAEDSLSVFCKSLSSFCKHIQINCDALKESTERRSIPLDSASSTFIQSLNRRVSTASSDLNMLDSMAFGTVSFEELLGHCNEVYKKNQNDLIQLEDRLKSFGYVPVVEVDDEDEDSGTPFGLDSKLQKLQDGLELPSVSRGEFSSAGSIMKRLEDDPLFEESLSLQKLGLSDVCLATLASEANDKNEIQKMSMQNPMNNLSGAPHETKGSCQYAKDILGHEEDDTKSLGGATYTQIKISKDDYENLPSYIKSLASWEDLQAAVEKINSTLSKQENSEERNLLYQDKLTSWLGPKGRSYLLLLLRMNCLVVEPIGDSILYRVL
ncbi:uncharacterized protein LOC122057646 [Macadamia integrifolia]|uniref:uncharacterized protein LOC122057646 n=1 Tax=Macadamia integrifolia TaxID=60698 RepID=UPI001C52F2A0|nr:uncharacterized protein LOC122057646 [Macadamia integrifolia]